MLDPVAATAVAVTLFGSALLLLLLVGVIVGIVVVVVVVVVLVGSLHNMRANGRSAAIIAPRAQKITRDLTR